MLNLRYAKASNLRTKAIPLSNLTKPYLIAEVSGNHNGDIERAKEIITAAAKAGADCVKLQTYTPETITIKSDRAEFQIKGGLWDGKSLWDIYEWAHTPYEWHAPLFAHARGLGVECISTPFDETAVDLLEGLDCAFYKIASFEIVDIPLIEYVAATGKAMIMSTGLASLEDVERALTAARAAGAGEIVLLHCVSGYPTPTDQMNLRKIETLRARFGVEVGLSDHSLDNVAAIASVGLGVKVIEKHLTLRRADGGPDAEFSLEPAEFAELAQSVRAAHSALGSAEFKTAQAEEGNLMFRRSIYVVRDIRKGEVFSKENIARIRPGFGLAPRLFNEVLGSKARCDLERGDALTLAHTDLTDKA